MQAGVLLILRPRPRHRSRALLLVRRACRGALRVPLGPIFMTFYLIMLLGWMMTYLLLGVVSLLWAISLALLATSMLHLARALSRRFGARRCKLLPQHHLGCWSFLMMLWWMTTHPQGWRLLLHTTTLVSLSSPQGPGSPSACWACARRSLGVECWRRVGSPTYLVSWTHLFSMWE